MITGITLENFKGFRERTEIELRPITLLFGANSAGKSSILHALHYAREIFERHNLDADRTVSGGGQLDLGGFKTFVHNQELDRVITLGFKVDCSGNDLNFYESELLAAVHEFLEFERWTDGQFDSFGAFNEAEVSLSLSWSEQRQHAYVSAFAIVVGGENLISITSDPKGRRIALTVNECHPTLDKLEQWFPSPDNGREFEDIADVYDNPSRSCLAECLDTFRGLCDSPDGISMFLKGQRDALPNSLSDLSFSLPDLNEIQSERTFSGIGNLHYFIRGVVEGISRLVLVPLNVLSKELSSFIYVGPLRELPPRDFKPPKLPDPSRWACGLGAWDELYTSGAGLVQEVSNWLGDEDKLNSGYRIERRRYKEIHLDDPLILKLQTGRAFDDADPQSRIDFDRLETQTRLYVVANGTDVRLRLHDVGIGISQVVPVIVSALQTGLRMVAIEQPELHLHPRLQAEIADLFIEAYHRSGNQFLIETHSEHLILRLLRRIRETEVHKAPADRTLRTDDLSICYLKQDEGSTHALQIDVDVKGEFIQPWPDDFFEIDFYERFPDAR